MSSSKFSGPFMQKSVLSPLEGNAFIKAKMDAEAAGKSSFSVDGRNYPLKMEIDPEKKKAYQDSIQKLHKPNYDAYVARNKKDRYVDDTDGAGPKTFIKAGSKPIVDLKEYAYRMETAKGGTVKKDGVAASELARRYK